MTYEDTSGFSLFVEEVLCLVYQHIESTHHPEEGPRGEVRILLYSGQDTEDQTHQDHDKAVGRENSFSVSHPHISLTF